MKINIHTSHPSAFISSTFTDLKHERRAVAEVLRDAGLNINALDIKPASNNSSRKEIFNGIVESDFIILIVGERYGSIIPQITLDSKTSITKWEYKTAKYNGKDVLVYFKNVNSDDKIFYDDRDSHDFEMKCVQLAEFKQQLITTHNPKYFSTANELAEEVRKALIPTYRAGVKSLITENELLEKEVSTLKQKVETLNAQLIPSAKNSEPLPPSGEMSRPNQGIISRAMGLSDPPTPTIGKGLLRDKG